MLTKWNQLSEAARTKYRDDRREYIGQTCTLNGLPAKILFNYREGCASVGQLDGPLIIDWSWAAVFNIVDNKRGDFRA